MASLDVLHTRRCFYIGGELQPGGPQASTTTARVFAGQIYVEELRPAVVSRAHPVVFWPGTGSTGACWVTKPDGEPGWASYFLQQGYTVYLVDPPERGRSQALPNTGRFVTIDQEYAEKFWTATASNGDLWPSAKLHSQWPGSGKLSDPAFDQFLASQVQSRADYVIAETLAQKAGARLLEKIGPSILVTHSSGASPGWLIADTVPHLVKAIVALEPLGAPFVNHIASAVTQIDTNKRVRPYGITTAPLTYDPPLSSPHNLTTKTLPATNPTISDVLLQTDPPRKLINLTKIPVAIVTGESGYHSYYDHATVAYMAQAGVTVEHLVLSEKGIRGNGHFMILEKNSDQIAEVVHRWLGAACA